MLEKITATVLIKLRIGYFHVKNWLNAWRISTATKPAKVKADRLYAFLYKGV